MKRSAFIGVIAAVLSGIGSIKAAESLLSSTGVATNAPLVVAAPVDASIGGAVVRLFGAFALVIALFLGFIWLWKTWQKTAGSKGRWGRLQIIEARSLGHRQSIYVVGYENERLLLGSSPQGLTLLTRLPEAAEDMDRAPAEAATAGKFSEVLMTVLNGKR
jgi:flagellar protein FliO/FliZ